ncbi:GlcNAc-PI de-N-acetylase [Rhizocola hellebori]|uniref:GlcNAc-PI de-N-acetylase n=1 Tax=Rhizocola hellebori TaxID=1392758 RepID=A0A8J3QGC5_9ACTN|nr:PIG-L deacetylase family protein [Rhizocola hellebori]GIH10544.1 GlcNAc-PI de-N-acetylase [Rhizocola hellebori]
MGFPRSVDPLPDVQRVLCVFAHPDDVDFGSGGTVAAWVDAGIEVSYLLVTRGDSGGFDATPRDQMPLIRESEQRAAAAALGVKQVEFLEGYSDGSITPSLELRKDITAGIRRFRPDRILTSSPLRRWDRLAGPSHPDHLAVGEATTSAVYPDARNEFAHPDLLEAGLEPWVVREMWFSGGPDPDHRVDVTDVFDRKLTALRAHVTQTSHMSNLEEMLRERLSALSEQPGRLAEAFTIIRTE